ncbi:ATPase [Rhodobacterales bacterium HKCCE2091]|nr:ATPase [Rhodobacterales bacterium HKCCE2091]
MSEWAAKRFWTEAQVEPADGGYALKLDGRPVRSPGKRPLILPSAGMAEAAAAEWAAQEDVIDPTTMPVTRSANSALDQTGPAREGVIDMLAAYGETDLLCYRAEEPEGLVERQVAAWDPLLSWARDRFDAPLAVTAGVVPADQPVESLARLRGAVAGFGNFGLTGFYDLVTLSGSLVLALAVAEGRISPSEGWTVSRIDEDWQIEQWGADEEAAETAARKAHAFDHAARFLAWSGNA